MAQKTDLYISTQKGLFRGKLNASLEDVEPLGLADGVGTLTTVVIDRKNSDRLYVGTRRAGVFVSEDRGKTWHARNHGLIYKECWSMVQHPLSGVIYLGTGPAAVFKSADDGESWEFCEQMHSMPETIDWTFPNPPHIAHVKGLAINPQDPNQIYGAIEEGWLVRSLDGGATWVTLKSGTDYDSHTVNVMPNDPRVLVSTSGDGIYRSEDGGDHFAPANDGLTRRYCAQLVVHKDQPNVLFTAAAEIPPLGWSKRPEGANSKFFRSNDQGRKWNELAGGLPEQIKGAPRATTGRPEHAGSFLVGMNDGAIWLSDDLGDSFKQVTGGLPHIYGLAISPN
jgi:photosystem II stability/assembly factor-like uncharacterized protein